MQEGYLFLCTPFSVRHIADGFILKFHQGLYFNSIFLHVHNILQKIKNQKNKLPASNFHPSCATSMQCDHTFKIKVLRLKNIIIFESRQVWVMKYIKVKIPLLGNGKLMSLMQLLIQQQHVHTLYMRRYFSSSSVNFMKMNILLLFFFGPYSHCLSGPLSGTQAGLTKQQFKMTWPQHHTKSDA